MICVDPVKSRMRVACRREGRAAGGVVTRTCWKVPYTTHKLLLFARSCCSVRHGTNPSLSFWSSRPAPTPSPSPSRALYIGSGPCGTSSVRQATCVVRETSQRMGVCMVCVRVWVCSQLVTATRCEALRPDCRAITVNCLLIRDYW